MMTKNEKQTFPAHFFFFTSAQLSCEWNNFSKISTDRAILSLWMESWDSAWEMEVSLTT
jgi:hypothetical protein